MASQQAVSVLAVASGDNSCQPDLVRRNCAKRKTIPSIIGQPRDPRHGPFQLAVPTKHALTRNPDKNPASGTATMDPNPVSTTSWLAPGAGTVPALSLPPPPDISHALDVRNRSRGAKEQSGAVRFQLERIIWRKAIATSLATDLVMFLIGHEHGLKPYPYIMNAEAAGRPYAQSMRPYRCDQCTQSFNRNHDLKRHKGIHLDVKPFPCKSCNKSFSRKDALKRHCLPSIKIGGFVQAQAGPISIDLRNISTDVIGSQDTAADAVGSLSKTSRAI
ncbi:hypothetical protein HRG_002528 [Hirsutella rhossiliensis]